MENAVPCSPHAPGAQPPQNQPGRLVQQAWPRGTADPASPVLEGGSSTCEVPSSRAVGSPRRSERRGERASARRPGARRPSCRLSIRGDAAASTRGERQQQATVTARAASCSSAATGRGGGAEARAPREAAPPSFRRPEEPRGGECVSGPEAVVGAPAPFLVVQSGDPSLSWPLNSGLAGPWSAEVISTECQADVGLLGGSVG